MQSLGKTWASTALPLDVMALSQSPRCQHGASARAHSHPRPLQSPQT